jgi:hypothetical protein
MFHDILALLPEINLMNAPAKIGERLAESLKFAQRSRERSIAAAAV